MPVCWGAQHLPQSIDFVLLDGAKGLYPDILSSGALIVADNANWSPDYLARVHSPGKGYMSVPFAEDIELSMRVAALGEA
jgi:predicted O-methyltransferase YrrM